MNESNPDFVTKKNKFINLSSFSFRNKQIKNFTEKNLNLKPNHKIALKLLALLIQTE